MSSSHDRAFVSTVPERCRTCYTCVRECPAKAIRISGGQAELLPNRCIACGNCVRVCSQGAKRIRNTTDEVAELLDSGAEVAAILAPSFPAAYPEIDYRTLVGMVREAGFAHVHEVAFGADLVARAYRELISGAKRERYIATNCPAVVSYVERYHPNLVSSLAPIVSPMVAMARVVRALHGPQVKVVFIGPCIAKKCEAIDESVPDNVDAASTFSGLDRLLYARSIRPEDARPSDFDPPHASLGALFPINRGLLQAAEVTEDLMAGEVVTAEGREGFVEAIREFEAGALDAKLIELLACQGCIMGIGMTTDAPQFRRRSHVSRHVRETIKTRSEEEWTAAMDRFSTIPLARGFEPHDQRIPAPPAREVAKVLAEMGKNGPEDELNCGACGYDTCREHAIAILKGLAEDKMCLPFTIDQLNRTIRDLGISNERLARIQEALLQSEKLASMGQLAAGIAHELNNPLGVVLMYAHLLREGNGQDPSLQEDLEMITEQADRCKKIVSGLLHFARQNKVLLEPKDVRDLVESSLRPFSNVHTVRFVREYRMEDPIVDVDQDQMVQVLTNLVSNALAAMPDGGELTIRMEDKTPEHYAISVIDTGAGIPKENLGKVFEPFFTTKGIGKGTGLGLAVAYGIIKMHRGDLRVESNADPGQGPTGSTFIVTLRRHLEKHAA